MTSIRETTSDIPTRRAAEAAADPASTTAITTGVNRTLGHVNAMTATHGRSAAVLETNGKARASMEGTAIMIPGGPIAIATIENAIVRAETHSLGTFTCRAGAIANWFTIETASTPYAAPNRERSRSSVHSEWSPVVISETTMEARLIHGPATCDTCANKG